jgi:hypothetical protein
MTETARTLVTYDTHLALELGVDALPACLVDGLLDAAVRTHPPR